MYYSKYNEGLMRNPDIVNLISKDFYLAPLSLEQPEQSENKNMQKISFKKGETKKVGDFEITFLDFDFPVMEKAAMLEGKDVRIGATLQVKAYGKKPVDIVPAKVLNQGQSEDKPATLDKRHQFSIVNMLPDKENSANSKVEIGYTDLLVAGENSAASRDILVVEASVKPYINLVWSGVIIILVGFIVTIVRRAQEARVREVLT